MAKNRIPENDEILWADFISGNDEAFRVIYDSHVHHLFSYGCHFTSDESMVQDCIHDLFLDLYHYRSQLGDTNNIKGYLLVSLKRNIIRKLDQEKKLKSVDIENVPFDFQVMADDGADKELETQKTEYLQRALQELSARQREAIYLKYIAGFNYEEICNALQVNYQVARNLVYRGMEKLRENFSRNTLILWMFLYRAKDRAKKI